MVTWFRGCYHRWYPPRYPQLCIPTVSSMFFLFPKDRSAPSPSIARPRITCRCMWSSDWTEHKTWRSWRSCVVIQMPSRGRLSSCVKHVPAMGRVAFYKLWAIISVLLRATCAALATRKKRAGRSGKRKHRWVLIEMDWICGCVKWARLSSCDLDVWSSEFYALIFSDTGICCHWRDMLKCFKPSVRGGGDGEDFHFKTRSFPEPGFTEMSSSASMFFFFFWSCASHSVP